MTATVYTKPAVRHAWAETAGTADLVDPGDTYAEAGWPQSTTPPPRQYFNWALQYSSIGVRYLCQNGVATWDPAEEYPQNAVTQYNGVLYQAISANTGAEPDTSPTEWGGVGVASPPTGASGNSAVPASWVASGFLKVGSTFGAIAGTIGTGQVPQGAVTQYEGALSIAFGQLTGSAANAQIPQSAVTQYEGALSIGWGQITGTKNADQLQGYTVNNAGVANSVALRDGGGNLWGAYFNQSSGNNENPSVSQVMVTNGSDNYMRKAGIGYLIEQLMLSAAVTLTPDPGTTPASGSPGSIIAYY